MTDDSLFDKKLSREEDLHQKLSCDRDDDVIIVYNRSSRYGRVFGLVLISFLVFVVDVLFLGSADLNHCDYGCLRSCDAFMVLNVHQRKLPLSPKVSYYHSYLISSRGKLDRNFWTLSNDDNNAKCWLDSTLNVKKSDNHDNEPNSYQYRCSRLDRREAMKTMFVASSAISVPSQLFFVEKATAAGEIDSKTGELFTPKAQMLSGGSDSARGTKMRSKRERVDSIPKSFQIYNTRFITYLARFLIHYDEAAGEFWTNSKLATKGDITIEPKLFAQFSESVEIGLYDYFSGPYGSYSSVKAAIAGISSAVAEKSMTAKESSIAKEGVLNLLTLLKARYGGVEECKRQLAILFSFLDESIQPVGEITNLLAEADNAGISDILIIQNGFGYRKDEIPSISIDPPRAIGNEYKSPKLKASMNSTGQVIFADVVDPGEGYVSTPDVSIIDLNGKGRGAEACAIIDRLGHVTEIVVLKTGQGYVNPIIKIEEPKGRLSRKLRMKKRAKATAGVAYEITSIDIDDQGNGYALNILPKLAISPPKEGIFSNYPDETYFSGPAIDLVPAEARVSAMSPRGNLINIASLSKDIYKDISSSYEKLLPSNTRPRFKASGSYEIIGLPPPLSFDGGFFGDQLPSGYRGLDNIFGGVSATPIIKGALSLSTSEYTRLGLAGAISTILVRTLLNPLELIKTKIQLGEDIELLNAAKASKEVAADTNLNSNVSDVGTLECINTAIRLRGFDSLFQSADITFLASLVFGSLGFGATELFRRSFTLVFFDETNAATGELTLILLVAASLACILTSFVATPFEVLRVKSMSRLDSVNVEKVLGDYMDDKRPNQTPLYHNASVPELLSSLDIKSDIYPLYASFTPVVSRELPFAVCKFLAFDFFAKLISSLVPFEVQVGVGTAGLIVTALSGALAGVVGAFISQPADIILTLTSNSKQSADGTFDWKPVVKELLEQDGGFLNFYAGFTARASFFFLVIGLQFFFYDYAKNLFGVGTEDLNLVLDVFYAVRQGLVGT